VKLLCACLDGEDKLLVYEYILNRSLDFLFMVVKDYVIYVSNDLQFHHPLSLLHIGQLKYGKERRKI